MKKVKLALFTAAALLAVQLSAGCQAQGTANSSPPAPAASSAANAAASQEQKVGTTPVTITIGDREIQGVLYDTPLAREIKGHFPLTVQMTGYGKREYYGGIPFTPEKAEGGQLDFQNGDITYCSKNNTLAIFYGQAGESHLTMRVIPIGKVTSSLDIFSQLGPEESITFSESKK